VKLSRPLDFLVVSDHAEGLGVMYQVYDATPPSWRTQPGALTKAMRGTMEEQAKAQGEVCPPRRRHAAGAGQGSEDVGPIIKSVWSSTRPRRRASTSPGRFTAMIGYEWRRCRGATTSTGTFSSVTKGQSRPDLPVQRLAEREPREALGVDGEVRGEDGREAPRIPHNGNLSNGRMFELVDFDGNPLSKDYASAARAGRRCRDHP